MLIFISIWGDLLHGRALGIATLSLIRCSMGMIKKAEGSKRT